MKLNLCSGGVKIPDYTNIDLHRADYNIDLEKKRLTKYFKQVDVIVCMSAINYFTKERAQIIINDCYTILKEGGIIRFGTQDLAKLCRGYLWSDFTIEQMNAWFGATDDYVASGKSCKYVYDFFTLAKMFENAGFRNIVECNYRQSPLKDIELIDNRENQMFYLECVK